MMGFTSLEMAVLAALGDSQTPALRALLDTAEVIDRENTGHGFYTSFSVDRRLPQLSMPNRQVEGPNAHMNDMGDGMLMGFILWLDDGYPDCLEGFQYGDAQGDTVDLKTRDLFALSITRLELPPLTT